VGYDFLDSTLFPPSLFVRLPISWTIVSTVGWVFERGQQSRLLLRSDGLCNIWERQVASRCEKHAPDRAFPNLLVEHLLDLTNLLLNFAGPVFSFAFSLQIRAVHDLAYHFFHFAFHFMKSAFYFIFPYSYSSVFSLLLRMA
jgi:hypothetical protein